MRARAFRRMRLAVAVGAAVLSLSAGHAQGAAFALQEQSGSGLGNAFAGGAAVAEDASTIYVNPAGMSRLPGIQAAVAGHLICPSMQFRDSGSQSAAFQQLGGTGGDAGDCAVVPNLYLAVPINKKLAFGLGVNVPFGLKTEYDSAWLGRFQAIKSDVQTINVNPALSWKVTDMVTVAAGVNWQHIKATLTNHVNYSGALATAAQQAAAGGLIPPPVVPPLLAALGGLESGTRVSGNDSAWGWNVGLLIEPDKWTRIGTQYRSKIKYTLNGSVSFNNPTLPPLPPPLAPIAALLATGVNQVLSNGDVTLPIELPDSANLSLFRTLNDRWDVMADVQYTRWSSIQELRVVRSTGATLSVTPENFSDTWRAAVGANYHYNNQWMLRAGLAYDQSPVRDAPRTPRLPDNDRLWLSVGAQYRFSPQLAFDAGYTYIFVRNPSMHQNEGGTAANGLISGSYNNHVNIVSAQLTYTVK